MLVAEHLQHVCNGFMGMDAVKMSVESSGSIARSENNERYIMI
jgi:hypothetical protein